jgi:four helix bundle protein
MSRQILKAGTSIGANLAEAQYAFSRKDLVSKKSIALKECSETIYWLELLQETGYIQQSEFEALSESCREILRNCGGGLYMVYSQAMPRLPIHSMGRGAGCLHAGSEHG